MKILDIDLLIAILKEDPDTTETINQVDVSTETTTITIFNAEELLYGHY